MFTKYAMKVVFFLIGLALFFIVVSQLWLDDINWLSFRNDYDNFHDKTIILWWTKFTGVGKGNLRSCGKGSCFITEDRRFLNHPNTKVILFYGSQFDHVDLPLPRYVDHLWALLHEESPRNMPSLLYEPFLSLFNISSTFSRYSNFPLTTLYVEDMKSLIGTKYFIPTEKKNELLESIAPVLYIQSDCVTPCDRDSYVAELMKYIKIDSYGPCLNNKMLPEKFKDAMASIGTEEFHHFVSPYKFTIAIENSVCHDYITEKLWRPLIVGSVPIYLGSPTVKDWLPNNNSAILITDFDSPKSLAEYLHKLNEDDILYESHLRHKISSKVDNEHLTSTLLTRVWGIKDDYYEENFVSAFECSVCDRLYDSSRSVVGMVNKNHYNCPAPYSILTRSSNFTNWWNEAWRIGSCYGKLIHYLVANNVSHFTAEDATNNVTRMINSNQC